MDLKYKDLFLITKNILKNNKLDKISGTFIERLFASLSGYLIYGEVTDFFKMRFIC